MHSEVESNVVLGDCRQDDVTIVKVQRGMALLNLRRVSCHLRLFSVHLEAYISENRGNFGTPARTMLGQVQGLLKDSDDVLERMCGRWGTTCMFSGSSYIDKQF